VASEFHGNPKINLVLYSYTEFWTLCLLFSKTVWHKAKPRIMCLHFWG